MDIEHELEAQQKSENIQRIHHRGKRRGLGPTVGVDNTR